MVGSSHSYPKNEKKKKILMSLDQLYQVLLIQILAEKMSSKLKWEILMREFFFLIRHGESKQGVILTI